jgi:hypothetical protein
MFNQLQHPSKTARDACPQDSTKRIGQTTISYQFIPRASIVIFKIELFGQYQIAGIEERDHKSQIQHSERHRHHQNDKAECLPRP